MFEQASRAKLRFPSKRGPLTAEDLWDLPLKELDALAVALHKEASAQATISFVEPVARKDRDLELALAVAKRVIEVRLQEQSAAAQRTAVAAQRQRLMEALDRRQEADLNAKSPDELRAMLAALEPTPAS